MQANYKERREQLIRTSECMLGNSAIDFDAAKSGQFHADSQFSDNAVTSAGFRMMLGEILPKFKAILEKLEEC